MKRCVPEAVVLGLFTRHFAVSQPAFGIDKTVKHRFPA